MAYTGNLKMAALSGLFRHQMELLEANGISWGRAAKVRPVFAFIAAVVGVQVLSNMFGVSLSPVGTLFFDILLPLGITVMWYKRIRKLQQRTLAEMAIAEIGDLLTPSEIHGLNGSFSGPVGWLKFAGLKVFELLLPHSALKFRLLYAEGSLLFTTSGDVYMGFVMDPIRSNALDTVGKVNAYLAQENLFRELTRLDGGSSGTQQIVVYKPPFDVDDWQSRTMALAKDPQPGWMNLITAEAKCLRKQDFRLRRILYLHLLGQRNHRPAQGLTEAWRRFIGGLNIALGARDEVPTRSEIDEWLAKGKRIEAIFARQKARPMATGDLFDALVHEVWRGFETRQLPLRPRGGEPLTAMDLRRLANGPVHVKGKGAASAYDVRVYGSRTVYVAHLVPLLPDVLWEGAGHEWLYLLETASFANTPIPVSVTVHLDYLDRYKGEKTLKSKKDAVANNILHFQENGREPYEAWQEAISAAEAIERDIGSGQDTLIKATVILTIEADTPEALSNMVNELQALYRDPKLRIQVEIPSNLQQRLGASIIPGNRPLVREYVQTINSGMLCGSGLTSSVQLGSRGGNYIGYLTRGASSPVFLDPTEARRRNRPGGIALGGDQGGGKSTTGKLLAVAAAKRGITSILLDFKAGETSRLDVLTDIDVGVMNLTGEIPGELDPYTLFPEGAARPAFEALDMMLGRHAGGRLDLKTEAAIRRACKAVDTLETGRSMRKVVELLKDIPEASGVVSHLEGLMEYPLAKLFFSDGSSEPNYKLHQLTSIQVQGLSLPEATLEMSEYRDSHWLSMAVVGGVGHLIQSLAYHTGIETLYVFFDESHVLERTTIGNTLLESTSRYSRFLGLIPVIGSQGTRELARYGKHFTIRATFRVTDPHEMGLALEFVGWPDTPGNRSILANLRDGECIFRDLDGRTGVVQITQPLAEYQVAFDTTRAQEDWETYRKQELGADQVPETV